MIIKLFKLFKKFVEFKPLSIRFWMSHKPVIEIQITLTDQHKHWTILKPIHLSKTLLFTVGFAILMQPSCLYSDFSSGFFHLS